VLWAGGMMPDERLRAELGIPCWHVLRYVSLLRRLSSEQLLYPSIASGWVAGTAPG